jgi:Fe-S cluster assembly protein SufD
LSSPAVVSTIPVESINERLSSLDATVLALPERLLAFERFASLHSGREKPGRFWRIDLESIVPDAERFSPAGATLGVENPHRRALVCDLVTAAREHPQLFARVFGVTNATSSKFGALTRAFAQLGAFVYIPADLGAEEPITLTYDVARGGVAFPYTVVLAERGARVTLVERLRGGDGAFVCSVTEIVTDEAARVTYASIQELAGDAQVFATRSALPGRDSAVAWATAEIGSALTVSSLGVSIEQPGAETQLTALFFPDDAQHVDVVSNIDHKVGDSTSETLVKSAAVDRGQARFLGNIRIAAHAQGSNASLRDDALLLSEKAHIDSIPALEIAANDVKAYHGATVGALDEEQIFYMESRGIARNAAERMIALGFFEPAIDRFPSHALRDEIRNAIQSKLT